MVKEDNEVLQLAECWRPYRSLAVAYLFQAAFENGKTRLASVRRSRD